MVVGGACGGVWGGKKREHMYTLYSFEKGYAHGTTLVHSKVHAKVYTRVHAKISHTPGHPQGVRRMTESALTARLKLHSRRLRPMEGGLGETIAAKHG